MPEAATSTAFKLDDRRSKLTDLVAVQSIDQRHGAVRRYPGTMPAPPSQKCRVLLDTNVWSNVAREDQVEAVRKVARGNGVEIVASPAVVYELLRTSNPEFRRRDLKAVTLSSWSRPMSDTFQLAEELRSEISRLHPEWLRNPPDLASWHAQRADWAGSKGFWLQARRHPEVIHQVIANLEQNQIGVARSEFKAERESTTIEFADLDLSKVTSIFVDRPAGWEGEKIEAWRTTAYAIWTKGLFGSSSRALYREWLGPWVDLKEVGRNESPWIRFWIYEVDRDRMPLHWLAFAFTVAATTRKVTPGTPVDCQIGLYLPACEFFVTGDRVFGEIVDKVRQWSPVKLGEVRVLPSGKDGALELVRFLASLGGSVKAPE